MLVFAAGVLVGFAFALSGSASSKISTRQIVSTIAKSYVAATRTPIGLLDPDLREMLEAAQKIVDDLTSTKEVDIVADMVNANIGLVKELDVGKPSSGVHSQDWELVGRDVHE